MPKRSAKLWRRRSKAGSKSSSENTIAKGRESDPFFDCGALEMAIISSTQNKRVRIVKALQTKARLRRGEKKLVLEGDRLIGDALQSGGHPDLALYAPERADYTLIARLQNSDCQLLPVSHEVLRYASDTQGAPGIVAVFHIPKPPLPSPVKRAVILDAIREPGNLGAILRSAAAAGVEIAIVAPNCVDPYNSKVMRAGMGAHFRLPIVEATWAEIRAYCADLQICAAAADGECAYADVNWDQPWALIIGNEASGVSSQARMSSSFGVSIPMSRDTESLNAAAAAAVILFEAQRQRMSAD